MRKICSCRHLSLPIVFRPPLDCSCNGWEQELIKFIHFYQVSTPVTIEQKYQLQSCSIVHDDVNNGCTVSIYMPYHAPSSDINVLRQYWEHNLRCQCQSWHFHHPLLVGTCEACHVQDAIGLCSSLCYSLWDLWFVSSRAGTIVQQRGQNNLNLHCVIISCLVNL